MLELKSTAAPHAGAGQAEDLAGYDKSRMTSVRPGPHSLVAISNADVESAASAS